MILLSRFHFFINYLKDQLLAPQRRKIIFISCGPFLLGLLSIYFYLSGDRYISTDNAYLKADKVSIATEVSGRIAAIRIKDNTFVSQGELLFEIEKDSYLLAVLQAEANLSNTRNELLGYKASYQQKLASLASCAANLRYARAEYDRAAQLARKDILAPTKLDEALYKKDAAERNFEALRYKAEAAKARLDNQPGLPLASYSQYKNALAKLDKARLDLRHTEIVAPVDGVVAQLDTITPGAYVSTGMPLFNIVRNQDIWVEANFKETDLTNIQPGQEALIEIDTYSGKSWKAKVASIAPATGSEFALLPPQNGSGNWVKVVQRIMVRLELLPRQETLPLAAGMSSNVTVDTGYTRFSRFLKKIY